MEFDYDRVLLPEWTRLRIPPIGQRGYCALRLTQRLLDPVPAGNCKLQTLRQFYRLPERGAHSALGDVLTLLDLFRVVLLPLLKEHQLNDWDAIVRFSEKEWFPSRIAFGKFKGRLYSDARHDKELQDWLEWLSRSQNKRSSRMGLWYLEQLESFDDTTSSYFTAATAIDLNKSTGVKGEARTGLVIFKDLELEQIRYLINAARERLSDLQVIYARDSNSIGVTQATLFNLLKEDYKKRDELQLLVDFRRRIIEQIMLEGEEGIENIREEFRESKSRAYEEYKEAEILAQSKKSLTEEEQGELKSLARKLTSIFHPDRIMDADVRQTYTKIQQEINIAYKQGNIEKLREIADDPQMYVKRLGYAELDLSEDSELYKLKRLYESLQGMILETLEAIDELRLDPNYELTRLVARRPEYINEIAEMHRCTINKQCKQLSEEAEKLRKEIEDLTGLSISKYSV
ncbi:hypothetical protein Thi970DRAFT_01893 [Thiorhodovibrio frisius]|uniref:DnaJ-class molecular chaperone with C-terminal Zn finger domain n=2 Tax=Thiorhodovibrio frisius TaxID=631362 RepID=H8Z2T7_9GAMM|nr:hypothetical protein Thi970DRAFT_01893 [Thiorhodovibrio frisius]WPL21641.1 DNA polymerase III subunit epsilon [Thiorhodovibrio frisius]